MGSGSMSMVWRAMNEFGGPVGGLETDDGLALQSLSQIVDSLKEGHSFTLTLDGHTVSLGRDVLEEGPDLCYWFCDSLEGKLLIFSDDLAEFKHSVIRCFNDHVHFSGILFA